MVLKGLKKMPSISKIRLTNVVYEEGNKRYNDELFLFDGHNGAILLENGGGKTVLIQTALQAILPHVDLADRKIKNTLTLENAPAHIAIEWIMSDQPRRYVVTAVSLFTTKHGLDSLRYVYEYDPLDHNGIEGIPFVKEGKDGKRTAERGEMQDYYSNMRERSFLARTFNTIKDYKAFIEEQYHIISSEWESVVKINSSEGGVEAFFDDCKSTNQLFDRLLIPTVEDSIVGHDSSIFADMFEQQHTSFKNYKKLKETIEENKQIQIQLEQYVETFEKLHNSELKYIQSKQLAKGLWNETLSQKYKIKDEQNDLYNKLEEWNKSNDKHEIKAASYDILVEETTYNELDTEYKKVLGEKVQKEDELKHHQAEYYSLKVAELKQEKTEHEDSLNQINVELAQLDRNEELINYEDQHEEAKRALLGYFLEEMEKLADLKQTLSYELNPIILQVEKLEAKSNEFENNIKLLEKTLSDSNGLIKNRLKDMQKLKQILLANPEQEDIKSELAKWQQRSQFLDDEIIRLVQEEKQLIADIREAEVRKEAYQSEHLEVNAREQSVASHLSAIEKAEKIVINSLTSVRPQWESIESLYLKQDSIDSRITDEIEKLQRERNSLLLRERIALRYVDDYGNQEVFFGDPYIEEQLSSWKNQVDYLVTGVEYFQSLDTADQEKLRDYFLWPLTLITTGKAKQQLIQKINHVSDRIQFPITVLSTEEVVGLKDDVNENWIVPSHWKDNIDLKVFNDWKEQIESKAQSITKKRIDKENESKRWESARLEFTNFLNQYPYGEYVALKEELVKLKNLVEELSLKVSSERSKVESLNAKVSVNKSTIESHRSEKQGLDSKIERGYEYIQYFKEVEEARRKEISVRDSLGLAVKEKEKVQKLLSATLEDKNSLESRLKDIDSKVAFLNEEDDYQDLKALTPLFTGKSKKVIKDQIYDLELKIRQINVSQGELLARREGITRALSTLDQRIAEFVNEHSNIDENRNFPIDGKQLLKNIWIKLKSLKNETDSITNELHTKNSSREKQKGKWELKIEQYKERFDNIDIIQFSMDISEIAKEIDSEKNILIERKEYIDQEIKRLDREIRNIEEAEHGLDRFVEGHHFTAPDIVAIPLKSEELMEYIYNRKKVVSSITDALTNHKELVENEKKKVEISKRRFREFCLNRISDIKLQNMAINGVETKQSYQDIIEFKKNMMIRIDNISKYANEHIRKSDEDLQLFINQIHSHLQTLVEELRQIPKKTKVKVGDDWKQIFTFSIPEWEEEVGKTRIRDYIEWILQQLESDRFLNQDGIQDDGKIRKEVEMWLQSKQLIQQVMNNEVMKVSCRKVTNDNKVTTRSYSWEQSNVWSGGEKWSKNMTLFLGILNYVAEKKQHIQPNMKRHRSVILDNPFGKASSDHVLSPVFFVAEQLGFQIIALTAHAEGKFLQDYFPVIYSCRLRASTDSNKKVMTKEKWLHHAYFQDHDPKTIDRLGETEQLVLFD
ncbi:hypothetical protein [Fredinandcohnia sp. 179-A 10B2 NHS]|uniref:hypothetical protein n=1 Tax=Fredinandcohnia sp. 179-A 10B2 NHS TaxID=3235176 RepID=UPI0039A0ACC5